MTLTSWFIAVPYLALLMVLAMYGTHRLLMLHWWARAHRVPPPLGGPSPGVTVQLPVYNEAPVVKRLIDAVCSLDWPADALRIQVLDDSDDETTRIAAEQIALHQDRGVDIQLVRRACRTGYKAGALAHGLQTCSTPFVAIFDADFAPESDFLLRIMPSFDNERVGMVQARWGHFDRDDSALNRLQALLLDGHFILEHAARYLTGRFFNFNGTAGVWRRSCIEDAGGWEHDTVTEDLDLSYRAQLRGWQFVYRPDVVVPAELPGTMGDLLTQQHRWAKGTVQTARKLLIRLLTAPLPWRVRLEATVHLTMGAAYPMVLLLAVLLPPSIVARSQVLGPEFLGLDLVILLLTTGSASLFFGTAIVAGGEDIRHRWWEIPAVFSFGIGLTASQTLAVIEGLVSSDVTFLRTPKHGGHPQRSSGPAVNRSITTGICMIMALYYGVSIAWACAAGLWVSVPFLCLFGLGYGAISVMLVNETRWSRTGEAAEMGPVPAAK